MPDYISRKKLKKKALNGRETEGEGLSAGKKSKENHPPPKRKRKKDRQRLLTDAR